MDRLGLWWSWCHAMQEFIRKANILEFRKILAKSTDECQRLTLLKLLAEEEAKAPPLKPTPLKGDD